MVDVEVKLQGLEDLERRLQDLSGLAKERALRAAMFRPMEVVLRAAQRAAPRRSGALRLSLARMFVSARRGFRGFGVSDRGLAARVIVAPRLKDQRAIALYNLTYGRKKRIRGIFYGHFHEFGTKTGTRATRFLGNALQAHAQQVIDGFANGLRAAIERELRRR